ncbi:MAPEG family protein [Labrenzia sp. THAF82]|uniref:MAPEG family protein n=1 Tax=Labrenzia sp. THAF82 TaxID=2587861 RepID=UPI001268BC1B|nr:MAPEG family protein [Labrenzia sp. THAF82]QFT31563.1 MAPEG family protein [Labrenzia sp. THAF82]
MTTWILAVLLLYLAQIYFSALFLLPYVTISQIVGGRDEMPERGKIAGRADRALSNLKENLPFFLTLGVLALIVPGADVDQATFGASLFFLARLAYLPLYISGIPFLRSLAYIAGLGGNVIMGLAVIG